ncbi:MAG: hypothetical protein M1829_001145 [Trizodia sp. TS-e1964]|nr:MAG: hypothetical protein M1829_001145 [Trizodia sp. TS-e1964]
MVSQDGKAARETRRMLFLNKVKSDSQDHRFKKREELIMSTIHRVERQTWESRQASIAKHLPAPPVEDEMEIQMTLNSEDPFLHEYPQEEDGDLQDLISLVTHNTHQEPTTPDVHPHTYRADFGHKNYSFHSTCPPCSIYSGDEDDYEKIFREAVHDEDSLFQPESTDIFSLNSTIDDMDCGNG